jgi:hypothetical protein
MNDKAKHFLACFFLTFIGLDVAIACAFLREYDRWAYTGHQDTRDMALDLLADAAGIALALIVGGLYGKQ